MRITKNQAEALLFREARLLDERRYDEWLTLFTDDCCYWVPINEGDPAVEPSLIYDDRQRLSERVFRVTAPRSYAQDPPSRTQHNIFNVEVEPDKGAGWAVVRCNLLVAELRVGDLAQSGLGHQRLVAARCEYHLIEGPAWRIKLKKLLLLDRDLPHFNLTFIL